MSLLALLTNTGFESIAGSALFTHTQIPVFLSGAILMSMICALCVVKQATLRLSYLINACVALALLSTHYPYIELLLALAIASHSWLVSKQSNWTMLSISFVAALTFLILYAANWLLGLPIDWLVLATLVLASSGYFMDEDPPVDTQTDIAIDEHALTLSPLASFPNRMQLQNYFYNWRDNAPHMGALVIIRLEGFAEVNQHIGRDFGDLLLAQSANRIKQLLMLEEVVSLGNSEKLAHLGGLNFAFICSLDTQNHLHEQLIDRILGATLKPFNVANCTIEVKARASYVKCGTGDARFESLITYAYLALDSQPNKQIVAYQQHMMVEQLEQQARLKELASIDFSSELELYFQPVVRNEDEKIEFLELLLRWQHPKQGILSANRFIDDIRIAGLAYPLAEFVIERAAELVMALRMEGIKMPLSINVFGPEMLNEEFISFIDQVFTEHQLLPGDLIIECPLEVFLNLDAQGKAMVARLSSQGVKMCVDGLGDSPVWLAKLPNLAVEYVKVAPSLTADFSQQGHIRSLISGMVEMHNQQNSKVICEGVETQEQLNFTKSLNAFAAQGYYFSHPLSSVGMISWLKQWQIEHS